MDLLRELNEEQKRAVLHGEGPFLLIAGPGTGKTTVITKRIAYLIREKGVKPEEILALTFTEKAAQEMEDRVGALLQSSFVDLWVMTFHAFGERMLQEHGLEIGLPNHFRIFTETDQWIMLRENLDRLPLDYFRPKGNPTRFLQALGKHFSRAKDEDISPEEYLKYAGELQLNEDNELEEKRRIHELAASYKIYEDLLLENNALDFGDLIVYAIQLFETRPKILQKYQKQFKYIFIDEFQDTNLSQYDLVKSMLGEKKNLMVVGDDSQSIYKFRGAAVSNILTFKKDFPKAQELVLVKNYRSGQNLLSAAYNFIKQNEPNTLEYQLGIQKNIVSVKSEDNLFEVLPFQNHYEEGKGVVEKIIKLKEEKPEITWNDFAILVRANDQAQQFLPYLERAGIPYHFLSSQGLFTKPLVLDILSFLRLLHNYHESRALFRILNLPNFKISYEDIVALLNHGTRYNLSLFEVLKISRTLKLQKPTYEAIEKLLQIIDRLTSFAKEKSVSQVVLKFLEDSGYLKHLTSGDELRVQENVLFLQEFYKNLEAFEKNHLEKNVSSFLYEFSLREDAGERGGLPRDLAEGPEAIKIMTIHGAKGLEFGYVFLVNLVEGRFPTQERGDPIELPEALVRDILPEGDVHIEEERRLFYVGMTRAKHGLFLTWAEDYGGKRKRKASRFLYELGLLEKISKVYSKSSAFFILENGIEEEESKSLTPRVSNNTIYQLPNKFSYTQLKAYETCPYQYRFAHILKIPAPSRATYSFGKSVHAALYQFFRLFQNPATQDLFGNTTHKVPSLDDLLRLYQENWIGEWYTSKQEEERFRKDGERALKKFYELHEKRWPKIKYLEKAFHLRLGDHIIKGVIDRVDDLGNGNIEIIDYKTGSLPQDAKSKVGQLFLYALAAKEVLKENPEKVTFYYIEENKVLSFPVREQDLIKAKDWCIKYINKILEQNFTATPGFSCQFCDYRSICDFRMK